ncbi:hypothetical protein [Parvularcula marina]|uniref:hypothetical protein n=1 Tax=Parvularcula marina TaxID=2292771 RepID=UPI0011C04E8B|nr:hypothetical protein [Parvularcula marina]
MLTENEILEFLATHEQGVKQADFFNHFKCKATRRDIERSIERCVDQQVIIIDGPKVLTNPNHKAAA